MNQARSGRFSDPSDFDEPKVPTPWGLIVTLAIIGGVLCGLSAFIGDYFGYERGKAQSTVLVKPCPAPAPAALTQWQCNSAELREYKNVCLRRLKRAEIPQ